MNNSPWLLSLDEDLYEYDRVEIPDELIEEWWDFPYDPFEIQPPHKDEPVVSETEENQRKWDCYQDMHHRLRGKKNHTKLMLLLQAFLYDGDLRPEVVEVWHHDLVDQENKIMAEVGYNGTCSNGIRAFMKRVFKFLCDHGYELDDPRDWKFWYLNHDRELFKAELEPTAYEKVFNRDIIDLRKYDEE